MRHLLGGCRRDDVETISAVLARATSETCRGAPRGAAAPFAPLASTARRGRVAARCPRGYRRLRRGYRAARRGDRRRRCPRRCCARWLSPSRVWLARRRGRARRARVSPYRARSGVPRRRRPASASVGVVARRGHPPGRPRRTSTPRPCRSGRAVSAGARQPRRRRTRPPRGATPWETAAWRRWTRGTRRGTRRRGGGWRGS